MYRHVLLGVGVGGKYCWSCSCSPIAIAKYGIFSAFLFEFTSIGATFMNIYRMEQQQ
jgi:hypothetical protein